MIELLKLTVCEDDPDYADGCPEHAAVDNYCKDQEDFMRKNCPKSCGFCEKGDCLNYFNKFSLEITELIEYRVSVGRVLQKKFGIVTAKKYGSLRI